MIESNQNQTYELNQQNQKQERNKKQREKGENLGLND